MSKYTTGEIARLCGVSVRTVQYYDSRNILAPSALTEGGRRLYSENDLEKMKTICFLRDIGLSINSIGDILSEDNSGKVLSALLDQHESWLRKEIAETQAKLGMLTDFRQELNGTSNFSVETIGDIAKIMSSKQKLKKIHLTMLLSGIPVTVLQWGSIILWIASGIWWPFAVWVCVAVPWAIVISRYYFNNVAYLCPECHTVFKPRFREAFWANHTPTLRKLTCTCCGHKSWCVETCPEKTDNK